MLLASGSTGSGWVARGSRKDAAMYRLVLPPRSCRTWVAAVALATFALAPGTALGKSVKMKVLVPASADFSAVAESCTNHPGPVVTISGDLTMGGVDGALRFQNPPGNHQATVPATVDLIIIDPMPPFHFSKKGSDAEGVTGNPLVYIQFTDGPGGAPLSPEIFLGRCNQGLDASAALFGIPADAELDFSAANCSNHPGPRITMSGTLTLGPLFANLILRNSGNTHKGDEEVTLALEIMPKTPVDLPKQGSEPDGVTGNPEIYLLLDGHEKRLGKCVQLSK
jgi:hypothetical protein